MLVIESDKVLFNIGFKGINKQIVTASRNHPQVYICLALLISPELQTLWNPPIFSPTGLQRVGDGEDVPKRNL